MQRPGIGFPIQFHECAFYLCFDVVRFNSQNAIEHRLFVGIPAEVTITQCDLLQQVHIAWVEINRTLEVACAFFPMASTPLDVTLELEQSRFVWQSVACHVELSYSLVIVEVSIIKRLRAREVCFSRVGTLMKRRLNRSLRQP